MLMYSFSLKCVMQLQNEASATNIIENRSLVCQLLGALPLPIIIREHPHLKFMLMIVVIGSNGMRTVIVERVLKCFRISPSHLPMFFPPSYLYSFRSKWCGWDDVWIRLDRRRSTHAENCTRLCGHCILVLGPCISCLRNDLKCVEWDVKPCSIQSLYMSLRTKLSPHSWPCELCPC